MIKWVTGCVRLLATGDDATTSILNPLPDRTQATMIKEWLIAAGPLLGLVTMLTLA